MSNNLLIRILSSRLFVILILLGFVLLVSASVYFFIIKKEPAPDETETPPMVKESEISPSPTEKPSQESPSPTAVPSNPGETKVLSANEASDPWLSPDGRSLRYLFPNEGTIYQINLQSKEESAFVSFTPNLIKILWSPNGFHLANIFRQDDGKINKYSYNLITKENVLLDPNFKYIAWSAEGDKIAYHYFDQKTEEGFISIANPDGKNWENLTPIMAENLNVEWPQKNKISFYNLSPSNSAASDLHIINPESAGPLQKILSAKYGLKANWSPSGTRLLFSACESPGKNPKLFILNEALEEKPLNIEGMADKCAWPPKLESHIYCALPQNVTGNINLPQDWYSDKFLSQDIIFKIDIDSGEKTKITKEAIYDVSNLLVAPEEDYLYFISKESEFLYEVRL